MTNFKISLVIPLMNEEGNIKDLVKKISAVLKNYSDWEIVFVDDGSTDGTLNVIKKEAEQNEKIKFLSFSRNFGHQNALRAGLDFAQGDCVISMDGDLQHPPELIPVMIKKWQEGFEVVYTIRKEDPQLSFFKRKTSFLFYKIINKFADIKIDPGAADFRLLDKRVVEVLKEMKEKDLFMRGLVSWVGFKQTSIEYIPEKRQWGKTKYTFKKMFKFALAGITSFSVKPLHFATFFGYLIALFSFLYAVYAVYVKLFTDQAISGWASVLVAVLFIGGIQMIMIGILGEYLGKMFMEAKKRPNYIIKEKNL